MDSITGAIFLGWLVTAIGWLVANSHANTRETRKERRAALDRLESDIDGLLAAYRRYLTDDDEDKKEEARLEVIARIDRLCRRVEHLQNFVGDELYRKFTALYEVITGGDFGSRSRKSKSPNDNFPHAVTKAEALVECAESWFYQEYSG